MKQLSALLSLVICISLLSGCAVLSTLLDTIEPEIESPPNVSEPSMGTSSEESTEAVTEPSVSDLPFQEGQLFAIAHLGYQEMGDLAPYKKYMENTVLPIHYLSDGDYYLIIPRYSGMSLALMENNMETMTSRVFFEAHNCGPFIVQCNVSDIFPDLTIHFSYGEETVEFSPFLSLMDGSLQFGERGLDITQ